MTEEVLEGVFLSTGFPGGNVRVLGVDGGVLRLAPDVRDSSEWWFYWSFSVETTREVSLEFVFEGWCVGPWGPAVSCDCKHWEWLGESVDGRHFAYRFRAGERVYFAHNMVYSVQMWRDFLEARGLPWRVLCTSNKGREVPYLEVGEGERVVFVSSRHHACESTGTYVLQGIVETWLEAPLPGVRLMCVPFADMDGVMDGDQGKARAPHDHNRDYNLGAGTLYREVQAIQTYVQTHTVPYFFDLHSPWHAGGENDLVFLVERERCAAEIARFSAAFEAAITPEAMPYRRTNNHPPNTGWNTEASLTRACDSIYFKPEFTLGVTLETCYFGMKECPFSQARGIELGRCFGRAMARYL